MKNQYIYIKNIFVVLILSIFPMTSVYAEKDLNNLLNGVYAQNEAWACVSHPAPWDTETPPCPGSVDCTTGQTIAAGEITYYGDGNARSIGKVGGINHTNIEGGTIFKYDCAWTYTVEDESNFSYDGTCDIFDMDDNFINVIVTEQTWYGHMSRDKKTITVDRLDGLVEGLAVFQPDDDPLTYLEQICSKTGVQIKLKNNN